MRAVGRSATGLVRLELLFARRRLSAVALHGRIGLPSGHLGPSRAIAAVAPWACLILLLFVAAVWIVFQPMQMRGTLGGGA